ncbi:MAG: hypothetical protein OER95_18060, partial [Acidimicrobiia bacterium]|nr:hypothetical protein [Acidimicrobiia bacterium]
MDEEPPLGRGDSQVDVDVDGILAFAFGNRVDAGGDAAAERPAEIAPGPVNQALGQVVSELLRRRIGVSAIWAQWEIAAVLESDHGLGADRVRAIRPTAELNGSMAYLSTRGVARAAVADAGGPQAMGRVVVVAHRDHLDRCLRACAEYGIRAAAAEGVTMPSFFDPLSGQPWTRSRSA